LALALPPEQLQAFSIQQQARMFHVDFVIFPGLLSRWALSGQKRAGKQESRKEFLAHPENSVA
jgi:hypothetical protein